MSQTKPWSHLKPGTFFYHEPNKDGWYAGGTLKFGEVWDFMYENFRTLCWDPNKLSQSIGFQYEHHQQGRRQWPDTMAIITKVDDEGVEAIIRWGKNFFRLKPTEAVDYHKLVPLNVQDLVVTRRKRRTA